jgi:histidine triad (HIT) family protein
MVDLSREQLEELNMILEKFPEEEREDRKQELLQQLEKPQCPFCLMSQSQIKTTNVYEDQHFMAVLEINPANPGHILLFPKQHVESLAQLSGEEQEKFFQVAKKLSLSVQQFSEGVSVVISSGAVTGVKFPHLMFNIMPRVKGDEVFLTWKPKKVSESDLKKFQEKILENMPKEKKVEVPKTAEELEKRKEFLKKSFARLKKRTK